MNKCRQSLSTLYCCSTTPHDRPSSDQRPRRHNQPPCQCLSCGTILCAVLQASQEEQRLPKSLLADVPAGAPPLLIDLAAPLAPFERIRGGCELLEKPDTPTGDLAVPMALYSESHMALKMAIISVLQDGVILPCCKKAPARSTFLHCSVTREAERTPVLAVFAVRG